MLLRPTPIPVEFIGRARALRRRIEAFDVPMADAAAACVMPLLNTRLRRSTLRREQVAGAVRAWRVGMPSFARVSLATSLHDRHATITECRITTSKLRDPRWADDGWENGIDLVLLSVVIEPRDVRIRQRSLCTISQHALARRYERGRDRSDEAVLTDIGALAPYRADTMARGPFTLPVPSGWWTGERFAIQGEQIASEGGVLALSVRTFLDRDGVADDRVARLMEAAPA